MIHSSIEDNWTRLEYIHSIAKQLYDKTKASEFRTADPQPSFRFCATTHTRMQEEACMVGMVMVWSVVTLESLANHVIAETFNNRTTAILAIEYPDKIVQAFKGVKGESELGKKIAILNDDLGAAYCDDGQAEVSREVRAITLADELAKTRNAVIHDKPFDMIVDNWEGDVEIKHYGTRIEASKSFQYEDLIDFFSKCDSVRSQILAPMYSGSTSILDHTFSSLHDHGMKG